MKTRWLILCLAAGILSGCGFGGKENKKTETRTGADRDEHGCIASAGYTWSEVRQDCIRLFEQGIRLEKREGKGSLYLVFSADSTRAELFFSDDQAPQVLDRRSLPAGGYAWNVEDDDTYNVRREEGAWSVSRRGRQLYREEVSTAAGPMQTRVFEGLLPAASGPGIRYRLTLRSPEHSGDGTFRLEQTYIEAENGKDVSFVTEGRRYTLRGIPGDNDATVWQCVADGNKETTDFLVENDSTLLLLGDDLRRADSGLDYSLRRVE